MGCDAFDSYEYYRSLDLESLLAIEQQQRGDVDLLVQIGLRYIKRQDLRQASTYLHRALRLDPSDAWTHIYIGHLWYRIGRYDQAAESFQTAIDLMPDEACPYWCLGDVRQAQGDWQQAEALYRQAVSIAPENRTAQERLERYLRKQQTRDDFQR
ncbi:tetratricopeptide repeat protein [Bremerella cremea]|uniref:tetratricopeptide repeat protein n=1 Tax=Bremerella cremea TaxID=1031537 RepID=UPI0031E6850A